MLSKQIALFDEAGLPPSTVTLLNPLINLYVFITCQPHRMVNAMQDDLPLEQTLWSMSMQAGQWYINRNWLDQRPFGVIPATQTNTFVVLCESFNELVEQNFKRGFEVFEIRRQNGTTETNDVKELINVQV